MENVKQFFGVIKEGEVRNPRGNPNIKNIPRVGVTDPESKLRIVLANPSLKHFKQSKVIAKMRFCNSCPLRPRIEERIINNKIVQYSVPAKCTMYKLDQDCVFTAGEFVDKMRTYYEIGENMSTIELQKSLTYGILENMELAKEAEMAQKRAPGFYTHKYQELAMQNLESVNKLIHGELNRNVNVNIDMTDAITQAYAKRKEQQEKQQEQQDEKKVSNI